MHVIATAGHVDHGKSTLVKALTGTDPDRLEEERARGLSIQLGYCWTSLPGVGDVAFVDVPGHERFISTMLSGIGPVPAALLVVAADDPWMPQAAEHLAALDALGVRHGVVAITRSDLADPAPMQARAAAELAGTTLAGARVVALSAHTGAGLDELRTALAEMLDELPASRPDADVRLWVDRRFSIKGAGTVVTGTLPEGTIHRGDELAHAGRVVRVRGVQSLGEPVSSATGVARVALNLTGDDAGSVERGSVLVTPGAWRETTLLDVRLAEGNDDVPAQPMLHIGAAAVAARCRPLGTRHLRITLDEPLPLRVGDRALLRDPGSRRVWGLQVLDPMPPALRRRGAAADRAALLESLTGEPDLASEVARRGVVDVDVLRRIGVAAEDRSLQRAGTWLISSERAERAAADVEAAVREHDAAHPLDPGVALTALTERVGLPTPELVKAVVRPPLRVSGGRVRSPGGSGLPPELVRAVAALEAELAAAPFAAPTADRLAALGLDAKRVAAAAKAGLVLRLAPGIVLLPDATELAVRCLEELPQPFTTSEARVRLATSRRVVLPLLEHLDARGLTRRLPDDRRTTSAARDAQAQ
ncbi:selenocysteine-specific translation elongation factor [Nocardioides pacificus]